MCACVLPCHEMGRVTFSWSLVSRLTGQVLFAPIHLSDNGVNQELPSRRLLETSRYDHELTAPVCPCSTIWACSRTALHHERYIKSSWLSRSRQLPQWLQSHRRKRPHLPVNRQFSMSMSLFSTPCPYHPRSFKSYSGGKK